MTVQFQPRTLTSDEFYEFVRLPENDLKTFELIDGLVYEMPTGSGPHGLISTTFARVLGNFVEPRKLGFVLGDNNEFILAPGVVLIPDASFTSKARMPKMLTRITVAPDIAVEVISPGNTPYDMLLKIETYLRYGTRMVIELYPESKTVRVYTSDPNGGIHFDTFTVDDMLTLDRILPGFSVAVRDLFPPQDLSDESEDG
jgi:Uma2 family endonuclease